MRQIIGAHSHIKPVSRRLSKSGVNTTNGNMIVGPDFREFIQSLTNNLVIQLGYPPSRFDILMTPKGVDFTSCYENRIVLDSDGISFSFIDLDNLLKNKQATGRHQDLADVENLQK